MFFPLIRFVSFLHFSLHLTKVLDDSELNKDDVPMFANRNTMVLQINNGFSKNWKNNHSNLQLLKKVQSTTASNAIEVQPTQTPEAEKSDLDLAYTVDSWA
ncbi:hypothetical protein [Cellulosilyticum ruminicola]|uniref:hypothetical protein n=1 Tax=Cellulosilyticum ruminicola TaxID=425254 RepID=UPI0006D05265|nr:hypothetical protein [Cellulosilyticum ruminicola]